ncbi:hypothetical protein GCM10007854_29690 [Algimonas porphyrae]|uniref:Uncharacterized protein n=1 Tax=Algimonas porphyrae TaxID=1128113 RepID=A0ABQ5V4X8_9PROT|nr:hypothetical protein GCM10007854_29690 [Algimonas porphyrae]
MDWVRQIGGRALKEKADSAAELGVDLSNPFQFLSSGRLDRPANRLLSRLAERVG